MTTLSKAIICFLIAAIVGAAYVIIKTIKEVNKNKENFNDDIVNEYRLKKDYKMSKEQHKKNLDNLNRLKSIKPKRTEKYLHIDLDN